MNGKKIKKQNKRITLSALVITIIILLILAGITIVALLGKNGVIEKVKQSKESHIKAEMKEMLVSSMKELQVEKSENETLEDVTKEWLDESIKEYKSTLIDDGATTSKKVKMEKDGIAGIFVIDEKLNITEIEIEDDESSIKFYYTITSSKNNIFKIQIIITDEENGIEKITRPDGIIITGNRKEKIAIDDYEIEEGKDYIFIVTNSIGEEKEEVINFIIPSEPVITIIQEAGYPTFALTGVTGGETIFQIEENDNKMIKNYYSVDDGKSWEIYTGTVTTPATTIKAKSVIEYKNEQKLESSIVTNTISVPNDALKPSGYDGILDTSSYMGYNKCKFYLDNSCWGMKLKIDFQLQLSKPNGVGTRSVVFYFFDKNDEVIFSTKPMGCAAWSMKSVELDVPSDTEYVSIGQLPTPIMLSVFEVSIVDPNDM